MVQRNLGPTAPGKPLRPWALGAPGFLGPGAFGALRFDGFCHPRRPLRVIIGAHPCLQLEASCDMDEKLTNQVSIMNDLRKCMLPFLSARRDMDFNEVLDFPGRLMSGPLESMAPRRGIAKDMALAAARATFCASLAQKNITLGASFALHVPVPLRYRVTFPYFPLTSSFRIVRDPADFRKRPSYFVLCSNLHLVLVCQELLRP